MSKKQFVISPMHTEESAINDIKKDWTAITRFNKGCLTFNMVIAAVNNSGFTIKYVPKKFLSDKVILLAIQQNTEAIKYVPKKFLASYMIEFALDIDPYCIKYIPKKLLTKEIMLKFVQKHPDINF